MPEENEVRNGGMKMASKKEIKELLKKLNVTEKDMDNFWNELYDTNFTIRNMTDNGKTWRNLNAYTISELPTQKEKDLAVAEEKRIKAEEAERERLRKEADKKYYAEHFDEVMLSKIDNGEELTRREIRELTWKAFDCEEGENRRWTRTVTSYVELCGRTFSVDWEEGLTEYQENEFYDQPYEVELKTYEKTIVVKEWMRVRR